KTVYQIGVEPNRVDVLTDIEGVSFKEAWKNKKTYHYGRERIYLLNLKDVIRAKRKAGRPKDKRDLEKLLKVVKRKKK
ncbi:MAG: hypothetical protein HYU99_08565, partial [Deltaproteobacteria bacterium]|nr:hypothetical protein [Deltaproteobacteria bacterium]